MEASRRGSMLRVGDFNCLKNEDDSHAERGAGISTCSGDAVVPSNIGRWQEIQDSEDKSVGSRRYGKEAVPSVVEGRPPTRIVDGEVRGNPEWKPSEPGHTRETEARRSCDANDQPLNQCGWRAAPDLATSRSESRFLPCGKMAGVSGETTSLWRWRIAAGGASGLEGPVARPGQRGLVTWGDEEILIKELALALVCQQQKRHGSRSMRGEQKHREWGGHNPSRASMGRGRDRRESGLGGSRGSRVSARAEMHKRVELHLKVAWSQLAVLQRWEKDTRDLAARWAVWLLKMVRRAAYRSRSLQLLLFTVVAATLSRICHNLRETMCGAACQHSRETVDTFLKAVAKSRVCFSPLQWEMLREQAGDCTKLLCRTVLRVQSLALEEKPTRECSGYCTSSHGGLGRAAVAAKAREQSRPQALLTWPLDTGVEKETREGLSQSRQAVAAGLVNEGQGQGWGGREAAGALLLGGEMPGCTWLLTLPPHARMAARGHDAQAGQGGSPGELKETEQGAADSALQLRLASDAVQATKQAPGQPLAKFQVVDGEMPDDGRLHAAVRPRLVSGEGEAVERVVRNVGEGPIRGGVAEPDEAEEEEGGRGGPRERGGGATAAAGGCKKAGEQGHQGGQKHKELRTKREASCTNWDDRWQNKSAYGLNSCGWNTWLLCEGSAQRLARGSQIGNADLKAGTPGGPGSDEDGGGPGASPRGAEAQERETGAAADAYSPYRAQPPGREGKHSMQGPAWKESQTCMPPQEEGIDGFAGETSPWSPNEGPGVHSRCGTDRSTDFPVEDGQSACAPQVASALVPGGGKRGKCQTSGRIRQGAWPKTTLKRKGWGPTDWRAVAQGLLAPPLNEGERERSGEQAYPARQEEGGAGSPQNALQGEGAPLAANPKQGQQRAKPKARKKQLAKKC